MRELTNQELGNLRAGASQIECFFIGALFAAALATANVMAAAGAGVYLAANCMN